MQAGEFHFYIPILFLCFLVLSCSEKKAELDNGPSVEALLRSANSNVIINSQGDTLLPFLRQNGDTMHTGVPIEIKAEVQKISKAPIKLKAPSAKFLHYANGLQKLKEPKPAAKVIVSSQVLQLHMDTLDLQFSTEKVTLSQTSDVKAKKLIVKAPFRVRHIDVEAGLLDDATRMPVKDKNGLMWYMNDAIVSFDGKEVKEYLPESGLLSISSRFMPDEKGNLWFRTDWASSLRYFDGKNLHSSNLSGTPIGRGQNGELYIERNETIYRLEDLKLIPIVQIPRTNDDFRNCFTNSKGELTINSRANIWFSYSEGRLSMFYLPESGNIHSIIEGRAGEYWVAAEKGLFRYNSQTGDVLKYDQSTGLSGASPLELMMDSEGGVWVSYKGGGVDLIEEQGIYSFDFNVSNFGGPPYIVNDKRIFEDEDGQIWLCTLEGFVILDKTLITSMNLGLDADDWIRDIAIDDDGLFWILSAKGLFKYEPNSQAIFKLDDPPGFPFKEMRFMAARADEIWLSAGDWDAPTLCRFEKDSLTIYQSAQGLSMDGWSDMKFDKEGTLWMGGHNGLYSFDGQQFSNRLPGVAGHVNTLSIDFRGQLIFAHSMLGIVRYDGAWNIMSSREGLPATAWHVQSPKASTSIVGTWENGCYYIHDTALIQLDVFSGLSNNYVGGTVTDPNGITWAATDCGLNAFNNAHLEELMEGKRSNLLIDHFGIRDGLSYSSFDGHWDEVFYGDFLYIPTNDVILKINYEDYTERKQESPIVLSEVKINEHSYNFQIDSSYSGIKYVASEPFRNIPSKLSLAYDLNHLTFLFRELNYRSPNKSKYRYRIKELNPRWSAGSDLNQADFRDLPAGQFTFELQSMSHGFDWSPSFYYPFVIRPAWYQSLWAYAIYLIGFVILLIQIVKWRTSKLEVDKLKLERLVEDRTFDLSEEKRKSEDLLLNILPSEVAEELKEKGRSDAKYFEETTVLFSDFIAFTTISELLSPSELVAEINHCFKAFDGIMEKYGVEKIKTIGDAYMAVGGLSQGRSSGPKEVILAALEMQAFMRARKANHLAKGLPAFDMRIGIHSGPVVAGIVGLKKFQYDIWGDTVNTASRMESSGEMGKVNISKASYERVQQLDLFHFEARGMVEAKGKGPLAMYFVSLQA